MTNYQIAQILYEIARYLDVARVAYQAQMYRQAGQFIERLQTPVSELYQRGGEKSLEELPEIDAKMSHRIAELLRTGKSKYLEKLQRSYPKEQGE